MSQSSSTEETEKDEGLKVGDRVLYRMDDGREVLAFVVQQDEDGTNWFCVLDPTQPVPVWRKSKPE